MSKTLKKIDKVVWFGVLVSIVFCGILFLSEFRMRTIPKNFDYNSVSKISGIVSEVGVADSYLNLHLELEDTGKIVVINTEKWNPSINDSIPILTDGKHYALSIETLIAKTPPYLFWYVVCILSKFGILTGLAMMVMYSIW